MVSMTNREWLNSMDNEKLASFLWEFHKREHIYKCDICSDKLLKDCGGGCCSGIQEWLESEHTQRRLEGYLIGDYVEKEK